MRIWENLVRCFWNDNKSLCLFSGISQKLHGHVAVISIFIIQVETMHDARHIRWRKILLRDWHIFFCQSLWSSENILFTRTSWKDLCVYGNPLVLGNFIHAASFFNKGTSENTIKGTLNNCYFSRFFCRYENKNAHISLICCAFRRTVKLSSYFLCSSNSKKISNYSRHPKIKIHRIVDRWRCLLIPSCHHRFHRNLHHGHIQKTG